MDASLFYECTLAVGDGLLLISYSTLSNLMVSTLLFSEIEISALFSSMKEESTNFKIHGAGCSIPLWC
jgi:hypothetical protein